MWVLSMLISVVADWMIYSGRFNHTSTRKIINSIGKSRDTTRSRLLWETLKYWIWFSGQYSPAICLIIASYTGCDRWLTVFLLTLGVGLNGGIYSGFKINHLDITPRFAGILMAFTNCTANLAGLFAPIVAGHLIDGKVGFTLARSMKFCNLLIFSSLPLFNILFDSQRLASGKKYSLSRPVFIYSVQHSIMHLVRANVSHGTIHCSMNQNQTINNQMAALRRINQPRFNCNHKHKHCRPTEMAMAMASTKRDNNK